MVEQDQNQGTTNSTNSSLFDLAAQRLPALTAIAAAAGTLLTGCVDEAKLKAAREAAFNEQARFFDTNPPGSVLFVGVGTLNFMEVRSREQLAELYGLTDPKLATPARPAEALTLYLRLSDNSLLQVEQRGENLFFSRNATGYGEEESSGRAFGVGVSRNSPQANLYTPLASYLEALAYVDGDWACIARAAQDLAKAGHPSVDPVLIERTLKPLTTEKFSYSEYLTNFVVTVKFENSNSQPSTEREPEPVFIKLKDSTLLRISQRGDTIEFAKNWSGYSKSGGSIDVHGFGVGKETSLNNLYTPISAKEVLGYFDGRWEPVFEAAARQARIIDNSASPVAIFRSLQPGSTFPNGTRAAVYRSVPGSSPPTRPFSS